MTSAASSLSEHSRLPSVSDLRRNLPGAGRLVSLRVLIAIMLVVAPGQLAAQGVDTLMVLTGEAEIDQLGGSVASAGDVNGDGFDDVIVGAPYHQNHTGRAYVYFGGPDADDVADLVLTGEAMTTSFGVSVAWAGDVNDDNYDDVIVGTRVGLGNVGHAYVYYGGPSVDDVADLVLTGEAEPSFFGESVAWAGDVNSDSHDDVIVGDGYQGGRAYIYYGGPGVDDVADLVLKGEAQGDGFGRCVASAGDVNGDGFDDVIVGAPYSGETGGAYVYHGGPGMDLVADLVLTGEGPGDRFGRSVASAGDVNGDGFDDAIVGASYSGGPGGAYVYHGGPGMDPVADLVLTGEAPGDLFGNPVASAGDVNDDGFDDVIVGARYYDAPDTNAGRAYIYLGGSGMDPMVDLALTGEAAFDLFGYSVASAGDVDDDGVADVIVGAPYNDAGANRAGRAYVFSLAPAVGSTAGSTGLPARLVLSPFHPNPLIGRGCVRFELPEEGKVELAVHDVTGRLVKSLLDTSLPAGVHTARWDGRYHSGDRVSAGVYFVRLAFGGEAMAERVVVVR